MLPLILILLSTSVLAFEENCDQSEAAFRNCLRKSDANFTINYTEHHNHTLKDQFAKWLDTLAGCGSQHSKCYLQTKLIKIMNDYIDLEYEKSDLNLEEQAYLKCHNMIQNQYAIKCRRSYNDEYGFSLPVNQAEQNYSRCLSGYARKSKVCGKDLATRYSKAQEIELTVNHLLEQLMSFGQYLGKYTD